MTVNPTPAPLARPPLPGLRLPLGRRRLGAGAAVAFAIHALLVAILLVRGRGLLERIPGARGPGGGGGRPEVNFFTLPSAAPATVEVPAAPAVAISDLRSLPQVKLDLPVLQVPRETLHISPGALVTGGAAAPGQGAGVSGGQGGGAGGGTGVAVGPGTDGEGGYIFVASPRTAILPPLARVPGSVAGRTYRVRFWVATDGRVTRVEVDPPITDADYSREFQQRMMAYQFYPARTRDGRNVASVVTVPLRIGR